MGNIYERLKIKDYYDIGNFVREINDDFTKNECYYVIVFADFDFIINVMIQLITRYGYLAHTIDICREDTKLCALEICRFGIFVEDVYYRDKNGDIGIKTWFDDIDDTEYKQKCYLHQDHVKQDAVDYCLLNCGDTTLFGIGIDDE